MLMQQTEIQERVAKGAAFLDKKCPDWEDRIDLNLLEISSWSWCLLGQLYGDYDTGVDRLRIYWSSKKWNFGFTISPETKIGAEFTELTQAWKEEILARRERKMKVIPQPKTQKAKRHLVKVVASTAISILILRLII